MILVNKMKDRGLDPEKFLSIFKAFSTVCLHTEDRQPSDALPLAMLEIANVKERNVSSRHEPHRQSSFER